MIPAWQKREIQRNRFIKGLMDKVFQKEEELDSPEQLPLVLAQIIIDGFIAGRQPKDDSALSEDAIGEIKGRFASEIINSASIFSRDPTESQALLACFLKNLLEHALMPVSSELHAEEIRNPEKIFGAKGAMIELPVDADE